MCSKGLGFRLDSTFPVGQVFSFYLSRRTTLATVVLGRGRLDDDGVGGRWCSPIVSSSWWGWSRKEAVLTNYATAVTQNAK